MSGWGKGIVAGDYLILSNGHSSMSRYQVDQIEYLDDPSDQWFADVTFAPRIDAV